MNGEQHRQSAFAPPARAAVERARHVALGAYTVMALYSYGPNSYGPIWLCPYMVMVYIVMAQIVMALYGYGPNSYGRSTRRQGRGQRQARQHVLLRCELACQAI